jgi:hypothetical protein
MKGTSFTERRGEGARIVLAACALAAFLLLGEAAGAAPPGSNAEADAASIEACLADPSMSGHDPHGCGDRIQCLVNADGTGTPSSSVACEKRREDAWNVIARRTYHALDAKLGEADRHLLRASQAQFELDLRDLCAVARSLAGGDPDLASASCASDLVASRALSLLKLAAGRGAQPR